jgi:hypothetical protein
MLIKIKEYVEKKEGRKLNKTLTISLTKLSRQQTTAGTSDVHRSKVVR